MMTWVKKITDIAIQQKCPKCEKASMFKSFWSLETNEQCPHCGFKLAEHDSGDGPAVFLSFILGFSIVPLILVIAMKTDWPLWLHTIIWSPIILGLSIGLLKPSKAVTIALQYWNRSSDWEDKKEE
ncbi:MAG: hypothetical protein CMH32_02485 [Micavibrio sp.]|nr:hypothetical protein [Micavibrio sp.]HCK32947.1 hypothetical protein [Rhodospirillaceae bacterium]|tara:strand:- start:525 stop:902 length:378 start_codon:yes stop_codon:yes gene_type:complete